MGSSYDCSRFDTKPSSLETEKLYTSRLKNIKMDRKCKGKRCKSTVPVENSSNILVKSSYIAVSKILTILVEAKSRNRKMILIFNLYNTIHPNP